MKKILLPDGLKKFLYKLQHWETWHWLVKYIPMVPFWIGHCIKARSLWFFTASNPTLTFGGYEGESKIEMYKQLPSGTYPKTILIQASMPRQQRQRSCVVRRFFISPGRKAGCRADGFYV